MVDSLLVECLATDGWHDQILCVEVIHEAPEIYQRIAARVHVLMLESLW
jgi:hypothetical protein